MKAAAILGCLSPSTSANPSPWPELPWPSISSLQPAMASGRGWGEGKGLNIRPGGPGSQGYTPKHVPFPGCFGGPQLCMSC